MFFNDGLSRNSNRWKHGGNDAADFLKKSGNDRSFKLEQTKWPYINSYKYKALVQLKNKKGGRDTIP